MNNKNKTLRIHCFQHVSFEDLGCIVKWCEEKKYPVTYTRFFKNEAIPEPDEYDWLIIMGGPMGIYDEKTYTWLSKEKAAIKAAIMQNKTVIGICLGSQLIADALGAKVWQNPEKEIGWYPISLTEQTESKHIFGDQETRFMVFHWHGDTFDIPDNAKHLAFSEICRNQAFLYKKNVLGLQFHLEVTEKSIETMVEKGSQELTGGTYIQNKEAILGQKNYIAQNNMKMFQILDYLN